MTSLLVSFFAILIAISTHELGHAYVANLQGDSTAKRRITLNPIEHIDPLGMLMMLVAGIGWARPVEINSRNFKDTKKGIILTSLAGAGFNILTAILCAILMKFIPLPSAQMVLMTIIGFNISFSSFNLLPLPLLDGWQVLKQFIPYKHYEAVYKYESMSMFVFIIVILTDVHMILMGPIYNMFSKIVFMFM